MASSDNRGAAQSWPINPKQQLEQMVDEGAGALLVWGLLDQHCHLTTLIGMNMNTLQHEPYPEGWWKEAAKVSHCRSRSGTVSNRLVNFQSGTSIGASTSEF